MPDQLRSCPECSRHVFERDVVCPFCSGNTSATPSASVLRTVATAAAVAMSVAAAAGCGDKPTPAVPDGVPSVDGGSTPTVPTASTPTVPTKRGDQSPAPVYGGPPP